MRAGVVGGGISGLTAAYRLKQAGAQVELFEGAPRVGGLLGSQRIDDCVVETGADSILTEKPWALTLAKELGLEDRLIGTRSSSRGAYVVHRGRLEKVPEGFSLLAPTDAFSLLRSPVLSTRGKLRMGLDLLLPRGVEASDESLESFVVRRFGREALDSLAQPLVSGIYGADPAKLSLRATVPRFLELEQSHRSVILGLRARARAARAQSASGARYGMFVAFREGMQELVDALAGKLTQEIHTGQLVTRIQRASDGFHLELRNTSGAEPRVSTQTFDALVVAVPAHAAAQALHSFDRELAEELDPIEYASAATVTLLWNRSDVPHPMDAFGFVVPARENCEILASTWASVKYEGRAPADRALIRVFVGGFKGQARVDLPDAELVALVRRELGGLMGIRAEPHWARVVRYPRAMPQYHVGHLARVARIEQREQTHHGFALAGNAYRGVGIPDAIRSGERAARRLLAS